MKNFTKFLMWGGVKSDSSSSVFRHVFLTLLCLVLGTGMAVAGPADVRLSVTVHAVGSGKVNVSQKNTATPDGEAATQKNVLIYSFSRYPYTRDVEWNRLSTRTSGGETDERYVNYAYIAAEPETGYAFVGWSDAQNVDPRDTPASTATVRKNHNSFSWHYRAWRFENVASNGSWNGIVKYVVTNSGTWDSHYDPDGGSSTKNLYAHFAKINTVTFNPNSGSVTPDSKKVITGDAYGVMPTPTRAGYTFAGWWTAATDGTQRTEADIKTDGEEILYAHWTANTITISFVDKERTTAHSFASKGDVTVGGPMPTLPTSEYKQDWYQQESGDKYFAGWYTRINGEGERIYTGVDNDGSLQIVSGKETCTFTSDVTLYAHYTHVKHVAYWDYSYDASESAGTSLWKDLNDHSRIKYGRLVFKDYNNTVIKTVYFKANAGQASGQTITSEFATHTKTKGQFHLQVADGTHPATPDDAVVEGSQATVGDAGTWNVYFSETDLARFNKYDFEPISWDEGAGEKIVANNWIRTIDAANHHTIFAFTGGEAGNLYNMQWEVTLSGVMDYPEVIYLKPTYKTTDGGGNTVWVPISQVNGTIGVPCSKYSETGTGKDSYATYTGSYPVWIKDEHNTDYEYSIGLTAFKMHSIMYYMDPTPGTIHNDMHADHSVATNISTNTNQKTVKCTLDRMHNPTVRFLAGTTEEIAGGAKLSGATPNFYVDEARTGSVSLSGYGATYTGYKQTAWNYYIDGVHKGEIALNGSYDLATKGVATIQPKWVEAIAPVITPTSYTETDDHTVELGIKVTDNVSGALTAKYITVVNPTKPDPKVQDYSTATTVTLDGEGNGTITLTNLSKVWVCVQAKDAADNYGYAVSDQIKVDRQAPVITPAKHVACVENVVVTFTDNVGVTQVKVDGVEKTLSGEGTLTLQAPTVEDSKTYNLWATDAAGNIDEIKVTIYKAHDWDDAVSPADPTASKEGSKVTYKKCKHCGAYAFENETPMTDVEVTTNIIPAGSVLVKTKDGGIETTKDWGADVNTAVGKVKTDGEGNWIYLKMTNDADVTGNQINTPAIVATLDLNGYGLLVDGEPYTTGTGITGNANVTILLKDGNNHKTATQTDDIPYANTWPVTVSPVKYTRTFSELQKGKWQGLYLPFVPNAAPSGVEYGKVQDITIADDKKSAHVVIDKDVKDADRKANTCYFIRSSKKDIEITGTGLTGYAKDETGKTDLTSANIYGSLQSGDYTSSAETPFYSINNGGTISKVRVGVGQRPYRWVIYFNESLELSEVFMFTLDEDDPTAINVVEASEADFNASIYTISGTRVSNDSTLAPGIYIRGGKKFIVR